LTNKEDSFWSPSRMALMARCGVVGQDSIDDRLGAAC
jgi:hypothetical protein